MICPICLVFSAVMVKLVAGVDLICYGYVRGMPADTLPLSLKGANHFVEKILHIGASYFFECHQSSDFTDVSF